MEQWWNSLGLTDILTAARVLGILRALIVLLAGFVLARLLAAAVTRATSSRLKAQESMILRRLVFYLLFGLVIAATLNELGFNLGVLLGAAGILTVAIGFASQTSASNLISGLFLIAERPFVVGNIIKIGDLVGEVLSIDLLSVKLRTFDNLYVRVPNEEIIKSQIQNLTHFPIRRVDLQIGVAYKEDIGRVRELLMEIAERNPLSLEEPAPLFIFQGYGTSSLNIQFSCWGKQENFLLLRNSLYEEIKEAFDAHGIEIPFPHVSVYAGSVTQPFPVRPVGPEERG